MNRFIILLRAVNVGGTSKLPMENLRASLAEAGFENVQTYIASGNAIVDTTLNAEATRDGINNVLSNQFGITGARTMVRDLVSMERLIKSNPFREAAEHRPEKLHVHFLLDKHRDNAETNLTSYKGPERLRLDGAHLYVDFLNGAGSTDLTPRFLEVALGTTSTARNWNTVRKLVEMSA